LDPETFWSLTPREVTARIEGATRALARDQSNLAWLAWHSAALSRAKKLPALEKLLPKQKRRRSRPQSADEQLRLVKLMHVWFGGDPKDIPL
jgi:hypothetical protein